MQSIKKSYVKTFFYSVLSFSLVFTLSPIASAVKFDEQFYSSNDILYYDPRDQACSAPSIQLSGSDNRAKAFNFFTSKGYSPQQAAGIVGNMIEESGVLPKRLQNTDANTETSAKQAENISSGWGIVQWTPASKMIKPSLEAGKSYDEIGTLEYQLTFLWEQLEGTGIGAKISEKGAGDHLKQQTTIDGAARSFMLKYERPADQSEAKQKHRVQLANDVFGGNNSGGSSSPNSPTGCSDTSASSGDIVTIAQAELAKGVKEDPIGCDSGNRSIKGDCGAEVNKYTDNTLEYWCADFVSWVYKEAGKPFTGGSSGGWRIAGVSSLRSWFEKNGSYTKNGSGVTPKPGDVYITAGESHTGIVERVESGVVYTISGNTSVENYSNGVGVGSSEYKIGSPLIAGYGSLK